MDHLQEIPLNAPITLKVPIAMPGRRNVSYETPRQPITFKRLECWIRVNTVTRQIWVQFAKIPQPLMIYGPDDFAAACPDTPEQHGERVLQILGNDPAVVLQALIDGGEVTMPARVPRSIKHWQAVNVLREMGLLDAVEAMTAETESHALRDAWKGFEDLSIKSPSVIGMAAALGIDLNAFFIRAGALGV